ncbi:MAG: sugar ABC transporter substrate-binding protein [Alicyclobacillus sp.]|nr:sugar ABC transporter substrate-binding protein [Alicyclobacillus sp.]
MRLKKTLSIGVVSTGAAAITLGAALQSAPAMAASHAPVTITVAAWNDAADSLKAEIPGFEKAYPWIHVKVEYVDGQYQKITPELVAGTAPDIIQTQQRDFQYFLNKFPGNFVSLNQYMGPIKNQIAKVALNVAEQNGTIYAAPWDLGPSALYYRKDLFKKAGIDPKSIQTWTDYLNAGKKLTKFYHGKVKMLFENTSRSDQGVQGLTFIMMSQLGGNFVNSKNQIDFTSPQMMKVMKTIQEFGKAGIVADAPTWNDGITAFVNGQVASVPTAVWYAGTMMNSAPKQKGLWGIMPLPAFTKGGSHEANYGGSVLAITKNSQNPDAAWDFIKYSLYTVPGENVQLKYGLFPSWEPYYTAKGTDFNKNFPYFGMPIYKFFASLSTKIPSTNFGGYFNAYGTALSQAFISVFSGKDIVSSLKTAEQAAARLSGQSIASS